MTPRKILFWLHLTVGSVAGLVILIMSVTGVLLAYKRQILRQADQAFWAAPPSPRPARVPVETLLASLLASRPELPATLLVRSDPAAPVEAAYGRERVLLLDPYTGQVRGEAPRGVRNFLRLVEDWHRWLATSGGQRDTGKRITGVSNLLFFGLILSGLVLWIPRRWTWQHVRPVVLFRHGLAGRARNFNWHNVIGLWCAVPLAVIVLSGLVMSFPWANDLLYRLAGNEPPQPAARAPERPAGRSAPDLDAVLGINPLWARAEQQTPDWQSILLRVPSAAKAPVAFTIDRGDGGRPDLRSQITFARDTGAVLKDETFRSYNRGRQLRLWARFVHTGEAGGVWGETVAAVVSAGGALLVWTGLALALRRWRNWRARQAAPEPAVAEVSFR